VSALNSSIVTCRADTIQAAPIGTPPVAEPATYSCFDFQLASDLPLPELSAAALDDARPLVRVRLASVPARLPGGAEAWSGLQVAGPTALLTIADVARFLIDDGREIVVDPDPGVSPRTLRLFLLGSALGVLCHQRGLLPLHANAVVAGRGAFAFAGPSGAGKSTLAAALQARGHRLLADDVCMVDVDGVGAALAWPGIPRLKLWADAARAMGHDHTQLDRVAEGIDKYHVPAGSEAQARPVPLRRLYVLCRREAGGPRDIVRLRGHEAMAAVMAHTYRGFCLEGLGLSQRHFRQCADLLASVGVYLAPRQWGFDCFDREVARLERHMLEEDAQ
jgi:hypothetical protein